jgi:hypothetical protein
MAYDRPNHTQIPNLFLDRDLSKITSLAELKVTLIVMRNTIGWHEKKVEMGIPEIIGFTGMSRQSVVDGTKLAIKRGTIKRERSGHTYIYEANIVRVKKVDSSENATVKNLEQNLDSSGASPNNVLKKLNKPRKRGSLDDGPKFGIEMIRQLPDEWLAEQQSMLRQKFPDLNFDYYHDKWCLSRRSNGGIGRARRHTVTLNQFAADLELYFANCEENRIDRAGRGGNGSGNQKPVWMAPDR